MNPIRGLVVVSTVAAALVEAYLANSLTPHLFWISLAVFVLMLVTGRRLRSLSLPIVMAAIYLMPAIFLTTVGARIGGYGLDIVWILPLLGVILSDRGALRWSLPARWQWPLVTWALVVAIAWPIVFLREANFALWILPLQRVSNTSVGISPWEVGQNVAYFATGHTVGILFIDALFRWYAGNQARFRRDVLTTMAMAAAIASLVGVYQGFVDLSFLNTGFWTYMIRASGTLGGSEQARRRGGVLDDRRGGPGAGHDAAVVDGRDDRGAGARHRRGLGVRLAHRPGRGRGEHRDRGVGECSRLAIDSVDNARGHQANHLDRRRRSVAGDRPDRVASERVHAHGDRTRLAGRISRFTATRASGKASTSCCGSALATARRRSR